MRFVSLIASLPDPRIDVMVGSLYRIKLYGQSGDDPEAFARSLAELLRIHTPLASALLRRTPVVIRENLTREEAENVREMIAVINGLCLVEPMDGFAESPSSRFPAKARSVVREAISELSNRNLLWLGLGAALLVIFFLGAFALTHKVSVRQKVPGSVLRGESRPIQESAKRTTPALTADEPSEEDLEQRVSSIEEEIPKLRKELAEVYRDNQRYISGPNANPDLARDKFLRSFQIRDEIRVQKHRQRALQARLHSLRMKQGVKQPPAEK